MEEIWTVVPSYPEISASSFGRILVAESKSFMPNGGIRWYRSNPTYGYEEKSASGRPDIPKRRIIRVGRLKKTFKIAQLVCEAFHGPKPFPKAVTIHIDEDPSNNVPSNLRWGSQSENLNMPKYKEWRQSIRGDSHHGTKLSDNDVAEIRGLVARGETMSAVGTKFGISSGKVCDIFHRKARA